MLRVEVAADVRVHYICGLSERTHFKLDSENLSHRESLPSQLREAPPRGRYVSVEVITVDAETLLGAVYFLNHFEAVGAVVQ